MNAAIDLNPFLYLERNAAAAPDGVFIESVDQTILNAEAVTYVKKIAFELRRLGVKPGDLVAIDLPESLSILFTEAVFHEAAASTVLPAGFAPSGDFPVQWIFSSAVHPGMGTARVVHVDAAFLRGIEDNPFGISPRSYSSIQDVVRVVFSSGTTGMPKALEYTLELAEFQSVDSRATWMEGEPFLILFSTSTLFGYLAMYTSAKEGRPFLMAAGATPDQVVQLATQKAVTSIKASPAQFASLIGRLEETNQTLPNVGSVIAAGSVMPPSLAARVRAAAEGCDIVNIYGSSEAGLASSRQYETDDPYDAGQIFPGAIVQIVDENDELVPDGQVGRIRHRHAVMIHRYLGDPAATAAAYKDGWFYCGDLGMIREDGGLTLAGRASEVLNAGGVKFDPTQLDLFAITLDLVVDACSFSYTASTGLPQIGIALVTEDGVDVEGLVRSFTQRFGPAAPQLVARIDSVPRNAMGKPMRLELAKKYSQG